MYSWFNNPVDDPSERLRRQEAEGLTQQCQVDQRFAPSTAPDQHSTAAWEGRVHGGGDA